MQLSEQTGEPSLHVSQAWARTCLTVRCLRVSCFQQPYCQELGFDFQPEFARHSLQFGTTNFEFERRYDSVLCLTVFKAHYSAENSPLASGYSLIAKFENADDNTLTYLAYILLCLASCSPAAIEIQVHNNWVAGRYAWQTVDDAILQLTHGTLSKLVIMVDPHIENPTWGKHPFECQSEFCAQMLPKCFTGGISSRCVNQQCRLHDPRRWTLQTRGTLRHLLKVLRACTGPVRIWTLILHPKLAWWNLSELSHELRRVWEEIARLFVLPFVGRSSCGDGFIQLGIEGLAQVVLWNGNCMFFLLCSLLV